MSPAATDPPKATLLKEASLPSGGEEPIGDPAGASAALGAVGAGGDDVGVDAGGAGLVVVVGAPNRFVKGVEGVLLGVTDGSGTPLLPPAWMMKMVWCSQIGERPDHEAVDTAGLRIVEIEESLETVVRSLPCLEEIDVSYCWNFGDREAYALSCAAGLRDLKLVKCLGVTDVGLAAIAVGCGRLEKLNLKWCLEITDLGIELLSKKSSNLKCLDISYLQVTNKSMKSISTLPKLENLSMVGCSDIDDQGLHFLQNGNGLLTLLQSIDISRCENITCAGLNSVIQTHRGLQQICASYCFSELSTAFVSKLVDLPGLRSIKLDGGGRRGV